MLGECTLISITLKCTETVTYYSTCIITRSIKFTQENRVYVWTLELKLTNKSSYSGGRIKCQFQPSSNNVLIMKAQITD